VASRDHRGGCRPSVAAAEVTTFYISGKMRGVDLYNFPAFDEARDFLVDLGHDVVSPADLDRELGLDETADELPDWFTLDDAMRRDLQAVTSCDKVVLLEGWSRSTGAVREALTAIWCGLPLFGFLPHAEPPRLIPLEHCNILNSIDAALVLKGND
jgi:hypothetical protein